LYFVFRYLKYIYKISGKLWSDGEQQVDVDDRQKMSAQLPHGDFVCEDLGDDVPLEALARGIDRDPKHENTIIVADKKTSSSTTHAKSTSQNDLISTIEIPPPPPPPPPTPIATSGVELINIDDFASRKGPMAICCFINHILCERFGGNVVCFSFLLKLLSPSVICALMVIVNMAIIALFVLHFLQKI